MPRLGYSGDAIAQRLTLTLPDEFAKENTTNIWKLLRSIGEIFKLNTDAIDQLFLQTNIVSATGEFLDDYVYDLTRLRRKSSETDDNYRIRYYRNVFVYNSTKAGMREIVFDVMGEYPIALEDKNLGAFFDSKFFYNDLNGGSIWGSETGNPYTGFIVLDSVPTDDQVNELCELILKHKALGIKIYLKYRKLKDYTGFTYAEIVKDYIGKEWVKIAGPAGYGDFYDGRGFYNDTNYPAIYGQDDESGLDHLYIYLPTRPVQTTIDDMVESLADNLVGFDHLYVVFPEE